MLINLWVSNFEIEKFVMLRVYCDQKTRKTFVLYKDNAFKNGVNLKKLIILDLFNAGQSSTLSDTKSILSFHVII